MAVKGSGVVAKTIDPKMEDRITSSPVDPRSGKAKHTQTSFPIKSGMKDQTEASKLQGISPGSPGFGPDASSPNPLDPEPKDKNLRRQGPYKASWGMKDANGQGVDGTIGQKILDEAGRFGRPVAA